MTTKRTKEKADKEAEKKAGRLFEWKWVEAKGVVHGDCGTKASDKVLALDMDGTIIKPKSGAKFAKNADDWVFLNDKVATTLKEYHDKGYKLVIMSNQGGIEKGHTKLSDIQTKVENITEQVGVPIQCLFAPNKDYYHKPAPGMWHYFTTNLNDKKEVKISESFYIGDAAGRPKNGPRAADFENTDYKFALNIGVQFRTPEHFFLGQKESIPELEFDPKAIKKLGSVFKGKTAPKVKGDSKEMVIFVGSPGSGKSTFWKNYLPEYVHVNNDTLKKKEKCFKVAREAMEAGKSVVIDNTNPEKGTRADYIKMAKELKYNVRCFFFDIPKPLAFHMDNQREVNAHRKHQSKRVGSIAIHSFYKKLEVPEKSEGFSEVETVDLIAGPFDSKEDEQMFFSYVTGKK
jgi:bifunctional polynucleotide phosphatase/kinase